MISDGARDIGPWWMEGMMTSPMKRPVGWLKWLLILGLLAGCTGGPKTATSANTSSRSSSAEAANPPGSGAKGNTPQAIASTPTASSSQAGKPIQTPETAGWRLVETKYYVPDVDLDVNGGPVKSKQSGTGAVLLDSYQDSGEPGNITLAHKRTDEGGKVFASVKWQTLWSVPPLTLAVGQSVSIDVEHRVLEAVTWNPPPLKATLDMPDMKPGYASSSPNVFHQPQGSQGPYRDTREEVYNTKATMTTEKPVAKGKAGDRVAIYINLGEGYGMRYTYEWR